MRFVATFTIVLLLTSGGWAAAAEQPAAPHGGHSGEATASGHASPHPAIPAESTWAGPVVIGILAMFLAAAVIGPIVRANMPEDVPLESHDEPPGSSGHHGASGTEEPAHGHGGGHH